MRELVQYGAVAALRHIEELQVLPKSNKFVMTALGLFCPWESGLRWKMQPPWLGALLGDAKQFSIALRQI